MNKQPDIPDLNELRQVPSSCMHNHVRRASRIVTHVYDRALRPAGLVTNQFTLLVSISLFKSVSVTQLSQFFSTDQTTLTRNLKILEKRALIAFEPGQDRRIKLASLTETGEAIVAAAFPLWKQAQAEMKQHLGQQNWNALLSLLSELKDIE